MNRRKSPGRIRAVGEDAGLPPKLVEYAVTIYDDAIESGFQPSGPRSYGGAVYAAARIRDYPVRPGEIADAATDDAVEADEVVGSMRRIVDALPMNVELQDPDGYVRRYVEDLGGGPQLLEASLALAEDGEDAGLDTGKSPSGFAAAAVYAASYMLDAGHTQEEIAETANVSTATIRNIYRGLIRAHGELEPHVADGGGEAIRKSVDTVFERFDDVPDFVRDEALEMAADLEGADWVVSKNPVGVAAGLLYVAGKENRIDLSQAELADMAGIHKETVLNRVKDIRDYFDGSE